MNEDFKLTDISSSISGIQNHFEEQYIITKHETLVNKLLVQIYVNKTQKRIIFKIKNGYHYDLLTQKTLKLLGRFVSKQ